MNSFNYKYLSMLLLGVTFVGCMEEQANGSRTLDNQHLQVYVAYPQSGGNTRNTAASDSTQVVGTVWLDDEVCLEAKVSNLTTPQQTTPAIAQTRGSLMEVAENIETLNLVMFKGIYSTNPAPILFNVTNVKKDGDFTITNYPNETAWAEAELDPRSFLAFAPAPNKAENGIELTSDTKYINYTVPTTVDKQSDLLVSTFGPTDKVFNKNIFNDKKSYRNNLTLTMNHVLTAVGFEAVGWDLKITKVTLSKIQDTGTISLEDRTWNNLSGEKTMSPLIMDDQWMNSNNKSEMEDVTRNDGYLMMIPQTLNDSATITIEYEGKAPQPSKGKYEVLLKNIITRWEPGKKVVYQLRLKTRPAVRTTQVVINNFQQGYTSEIPLEVAADTDDNLTFTWDKPWLKIHRGSPGYVDPRYSGATSGWKTGINNWQNLFFFTTDDNPSAYNSREAIVTVSGKKSGIHTFKVTQNKKWILRLQKEGTVYISTFRPGTVSDANYAWIEGGTPAVISYSISADRLANGPADQDWITTDLRKAGGNTYFSLNHKWNIHANITRYATITVKATYGNYTQTKQFKVEQRSSRYWIVLDDNNNFKLALWANDLGTYWAAESNKCRERGQGDRTIYMNEIHAWISPNQNHAHWVNHANFKLGAHYWSDTEGSSAWSSRRLYKFGFVSSIYGNWNTWNVLEYRKNLAWYRCVQPNQWAIN